MADELLHGPVDVVLGTEDRSAEHAALTVDVLGARVDDDVGAEIDAALQQRGGEDVVQHHLRARRVRHLGDASHVDEGLHRVRRGLEEDRGGGHRQRLLPLVEVLAVDEHRLDAPAGQDLVAHDEARTEEAACRDEAVALAEQRGERGEHRGHAGRGGVAPPAPSSRRKRSSNIFTVGLP